MKKDDVLKKQEELLKQVELLTLKKIKDSK